MGRVGRKFLLEGPEKIPTHKDRKIRIFPHGMQTIDKAIGCSDLGKMRGVCVCCQPGDLCLEISFNDFLAV